MKVRMTVTVLLTVAWICSMSGCGNPNLAEMSKPIWIPKTATWPELEAIDKDLQSGAGLERIQKSMEEGDSDIGLYIENLFKMPAFAASLKKFEETPVPAEFDTPERQQAKKDYLDAWKELEKMGKKGTDHKKIKALIAGMTKLKAKVQFIPGQTPPTGSEAKKYSSVSQYVNPYEN